MLETRPKTQLCVCLITGNKSSVSSSVTRSVPDRWFVDSTDFKSIHTLIKYLENTRDSFGLLFMGSRERFQGSHPCNEGKTKTVSESATFCEGQIGDEISSLEHPPQNR